MSFNAARNFKTSDILKKPFDAQHATQEDVDRQRMIEAYTPDSIGGTTFFAATILSVEEQAQNPEAKEKSFFGSLFSSEQSTTIRKYRVYIPEIHQALGPPPDIFPEGTDIKTLEPDRQMEYAQSLEKIKSYPEAEPFQPLDPNNSVFAINEPVWVMFQNSRTFEKAFILAKITSTGVPGNNIGVGGTGDPAAGTAAAAAASVGVGASAPTNLGKNAINNQHFFVAALNKFNVKDPELRAAMAAIPAGEVRWVLAPEKGYSTTGNARIREVFGARVAKLSEDELNRIKSNDKTWFNFIYGGHNSVGKQLGNVPNTDDGYNFRGRGFIQVTGRGNYTRYAKITGYDILNKPDLLQDPKIAAEIAVKYMLERTLKSGPSLFDRVAHGVGNSIANIYAIKKAAFNEYYASSKFGPNATIPPGVV